ncbi:MAG: hypothetical protein HY589_04105 [Candidatus Omnitrophica bacterium]|nr:hypothetical protein [Candidatus Omnitrophota bacterium]
MRRLFMVLLFVLAAFMVASVLVVNSLKEAAPGPGQISREQGKKSPSLPAMPGRGLSLEKNNNIEDTSQDDMRRREPVPVKRAGEKEYSLAEIPADEARSMEDKTKEDMTGRAAAGGNTLKTQPSSGELHQMRANGVVIY